MLVNVRQCSNYAIVMSPRSSDRSRVLTSQAYAGTERSVHINDDRVRLRHQPVEALIRSRIQRLRSRRQKGATEGVPAHDYTRHEHEHGLGVSVKTETPSPSSAFLLKQKRQARAVRKRTWRLARPCTCCTGRVAATFTTGCRPRARQADFQHPNCAAKSPQSPFSPTVHTRPPFGCHMREVQNLIPGEMMRGEKGGG